MIGLISHHNESVNKSKQIFLENGFKRFKSLRWIKISTIRLHALFTHLNRLSHYDWAHIPHHTYILQQAPAIRLLCYSAFLVLSHPVIGYGVHKSQSPEQETLAPPLRAWLGRKPGNDWLLDSDDKIRKHPWVTRMLHCLLLLTQT